MSSVIPFIWVPILAVICYSILIIALLSAKKNTMIRSYIYLLICFLFWTGGSMFMRLQVFPGYELWYEISILALFAAPFLVYNFLYKFVGAKGTILWGIMLVSTIVMLVLTHFEVFLKIPKLLEVEPGSYAFVYETTWMIFIPTAIIVLILLSGVLMVASGIKNMETSIKNLMPIFIGLPIMVVGNVASVIIPGNTFPFDTTAGIINALLMFYALYRNRLFKMTLLVSRGVVLAEAMIVGVIIYAYQINRIEGLINNYLPVFKDNASLFVAIIFALFILICYFVLNNFLNSIFMKVEQVQSQRFKEFSVGVSRSINLDEILNLLVSFINESIQVHKIFVCLYEKETKAYKVYHTSTPLESKNFILTDDNPCVEWLKKNKACLVLKDFKRTAGYKALHESEKRLFVDLNVSCIVPLITGEELIGIILIGGKQKNDNFTYDDITVLESAEAIAAVAVKNASMYEQARYDACNDSLTGILNRKSFIDILEKQIEDTKGSSLTLLLLNLDNFKLFNQLYGSLKGDMALKNVADIVKCSAGRNASVGRYGGKEFAICLPETDVLRAVTLAENIQEQVSKINNLANGISLKTLTLSGGICSIPFGATTLKEILENADMAVYNAKRSGKNKICVYSNGFNTVKEGTNYTDIGIGGYKDYAATIYALTAAIDAKDHYTFNHSQNVEVYATELAKAAGINPEHITIIREAALLHDIGKIAIPENLLSKQSKLTRDEYEILKTHVEHSISIIRHLPSLDYVIPSVVAHHERWDGKGYPRGITRDEIPIGARCLAIADSYDAMISERAYKPAYSSEYACEEIISQAAKQFDPELANLFVSLIREKTIKINSKQQ